MGRELWAEEKGERRGAGGGEKERLSVLDTSVDG